MKHRQCSAMIRFTANGYADAQRRCKNYAREGGVFCGTHARISRSIAFTKVAPQFACIWCEKPAREYNDHAAKTRMPIVLCDSCARALAGEIRAIERRGVIRATKEKDDDKKEHETAGRIAGSAEDAEDPRLHQQR